MAPSDDYRALLAEAPDLAAAIDECLASSRAIVRRPIEVRGARAAVSALRRDRLAAGRRSGRSARRHLPVQRPHRRRASRGTAAPEGQPRAPRRADRRPRARVPQRPGDDPWLRPAHRSGRSPGALQPVPRGHPPGDRRAGGGRDQLPRLRAAGGADADAGGPRRPMAARVAADLSNEAGPITAGASRSRGEFATVDGDEVLLRQAFSNLARNARRGRRCGRSGAGRS